MTDIINQQFGRLVVLEEDLDAKCNDKKYWCKCSCGNIKSVRRACLLRGITASCGCLRAEKSSERRKTHGLSQCSLYRVWRSMKNRCYMESNKSYYLYGGKGIKVCDEWKDFINFYNWSVGNGYEKGKSIDRIDSNKDYCPENCRWVDSKTQNNNTSRNHLITYNGETKTMAQWCEMLNMSYDKVKSRLNKYGWSVEKTFTTP